MMETVQVEKRDQTGSAATRRLRRDGRVPAVLYGHGEDNQNLALSAREVQGLARNHVRMVSLTGDVKETALVSEMQWDPLGIEVLHLDLIRVSEKEKVEVTVSIHVHGDPEGTREGGVFIENVHEVQIRCPAASIPEHLGLDVNDLHMNQSKTAADLELPSGVELVTPADTVVAHIEQARSGDEEVADATGAEPEVISKGGEKNEE